MFIGIISNGFSLYFLFRNRTHHNEYQLFVLCIKYIVPKNSILYGGSLKKYLSKWIIENLEST